MSHPRSENVSLLTLLLLAFCMGAAALAGCGTEAGNPGEEKKPVAETSNNDPGPTEAGNAPAPGTGNPNVSPTVAPSVSPTVSPSPTTTP